MTKQTRPGMPDPTQPDLLDISEPSHTLPSIRPFSKTYTTMLNLPPDENKPPTGGFLDGSSMAPEIGEWPLSFSDEVGEAIYEPSKLKMVAMPRVLRTQLYQTRYLMHVSSHMSPMEFRRDLIHRKIAGTNINVIINDLSGSSVQDLQNLLWVLSSLFVKISVILSQHILWRKKSSNICRASSGSSSIPDL